MSLFSKPLPQTYQELFERQFPEEYRALQQSGRKLPRTELAWKLAFERQETKAYEPFVEQPYKIYFIEVIKNQRCEDIQFLFEKFKQKRVSFDLSWMHQLDALGGSFLEYAHQNQRVLDTLYEQFKKKSPPSSAVETLALQIIFGQTKRFKDTLENLPKSLNARELFVGAPYTPSEERMTLIDFAEQFDQPLLAKELEQQYGPLLKTYRCTSWLGYLFSLPRSRTTHCASSAAPSVYSW